MLRRCCESFNKVERMHTCRFSSQGQFSRKLIRKRSVPALFAAIHLTNVLLGVTMIAQLVRTRFIDFAGAPTVLKFSKTFRISLVSPKQPSGRNTYAKPCPMRYPLAGFSPATIKNVACTPWSVSTRETTLDAERRGTCLFSATSVIQALLSP